MWYVSQKLVWLCPNYTALKERRTHEELQTLAQSERPTYITLKTAIKNEHQPVLPISNPCNLRLSFKGYSTTFSISRAAEDVPWYSKLSEIGHHLRDKYSKINTCLPSVRNNLNQINSYSVHTATEMSALVSCGRFVCVDIAESHKKIHYMLHVVAEVILIMKCIFQQMVIVKTPAT
jgi:hypothetical protein